MEVEDGAVWVFEGRTGMDEDVERREGVPEAGRNAGREEEEDEEEEEEEEKEEGGRLGPVSGMTNC